MPAISWRPNIFLGGGYDSVRGDPKQRAVVGTPVPPERAEGQIGDTNLLMVRSSEEFDSAISVGADLDLGFGLFSASAKFDYKKRCKVSSQATFVMIRVCATNPYERLADPKLSDDAWELLQNGNEKRFRDRFGDVFVSGQMTGIEFFGTVRIEARQVERQMEIAAKVQASYGLFNSGSASTNINESMSSSEHSIDIQTFQKGGSIRPCRSIEELFALASAALEEGRQGRGYPFQVEIDPYTELRLPNDDASFIDVEFARRTLKKLAGHVQALETMSNDIDFVLRNQAWFESPDVATLNAANRHIVAELNTLRDKAEVCATNFDQCQAYSPTYPEFVMPPRKVNAPTPRPPDSSGTGNLEDLGVLTRIEDLQPYFQRPNG